MNQKIQFAVLSLGLIALAGCTSDLRQEPYSLEASSEHESALFAFPELTKDTYVGNIRIPDDTRVIPSEDGSSVTFELPENVFWVYENEEGEIVQTDAITYTCTCSGSGGCDVFNLKNTFGCLHGTCIGSCTGEFEKPGEPSTTRLAPGGLGTFMNEDAGIHWVDQHTDVSSLMPYSPVVMAKAGIKEKWDSFRTRLEMDYAFHDKLTGSTSKYEPTRIVAVNIMGTLGGFEVRESFYQGLLKKGIALREVSCLCKSGSGCVLEACEFSPSHPHGKNRLPPV
ncbi:MAG: hypothetical protein R3D00_21005 [Bacteroidia bacterium]